MTIHLGIIKRSMGKTSLIADFFIVKTKVKEVNKFQEQLELAYEEIQEFLQKQNTPTETESFKEFLLKVNNQPSYLPPEVCTRKRRTLLP